jgi:hypothetical protein
MARNAGWHDQIRSDRLSAYLAPGSPANNNIQRMLDAPDINIVEPWEQFHPQRGDFPS